MFLRQYSDSAATGLYAGEGEPSLQDVVEESERKKTGEFFCSRYLLVLAPGGGRELVVASGCNQKLGIALGMEGRSEGSLAFCLNWTCWKKNGCRNRALFSSQEESYKTARRAEKGKEKKKRQIYY